MPIERFIMMICIKYQVIALKALQMYQGWSEDLGMQYCGKAMDMYNTLEGVVVNSQLPPKYQMNLVLKEEFEQTVEKESYKEYGGYVTSRKSNMMNASVLESERSGGSSANR